MMPAVISILKAASTTPGHAVRGGTAWTAHQAWSCAGLTMRIGAVMVMVEVTVMAPPGVGVFPTLPRFALRRAAPRSQPAPGRGHIGGSHGRIGAAPPRGAQPRGWVRPWARRHRLKRPAR